MIKAKDSDKDTEKKIIKSLNTSQKNPASAKDTPQLGNLNWMDKPKKNFNSTSRLSNSNTMFPLTKAHLSDFEIRSILRKKLINKSVEYYKPLLPIHKKLRFRSKFPPLSQDQKFKRKVNKEIRNKLVKQSNANTTESINTIFVGKNKVILKSIIDNHLIDKKEILGSSEEKAKKKKCPKKMKRRNKKVKSLDKLFSKKENKSFYDMIKNNDNMSAVFRKYIKKKRSNLNQLRFRSKSEKIIISKRKKSNNMESKSKH